MRKAFVFDLDGTLLNNAKTISPNNKRALTSLNSSGHLVIFATARPPRDANHYTKEFAFPIPLITYNGAMTVSEGRIINSVTIDPYLSSDIMRYVQNHDPNAVISIESNDSWQSASSFNFADFFSIKQSPEIISDKQLLQSSPNKILLIKCSIYNDLVKRFGNQCAIISTDESNLIQIMPAGVCKAHAVNAFTKEHDIPAKNTVSFGDDHNDLSMSQTFGHSVAMGNAVKELRAISTYTTKTNEDDGVACHLDFYFLR